MEFRGTKEEWRDTFNASNARGVRSDGGYIAIMPKPNRYSGQDERYERELIEYKANAKLIAASPNLMEALQNLLQLHNSEMEGHAPTAEQWFEAVKKGEAAVQKALIN